MFEVQVLGIKEGVKKKQALGRVAFDISQYIGKTDYNLALDLNKPLYKQSMIQFNITIG